MSDTAPGTDRDIRPDNGWSYGLAVFGGVFLVTMGFFQFLEGLSAILKDKVYVSGVSYTYQFDLTTWGWIHLLIGVIAVIVGLAILGGQTWGLVIGIVIAMLSALANFMFLPYYPLWAIVIIGIDVAIVWALSVQLTRR